MITVTAKATAAMIEHLQNQNKSTVRIFLKMGGCGMRSFGVAVESPLESDTIIKVDGVTYIINKIILKRYGPIKIDSDGFSFRLSGKGIHPPLGCGTCGYGCGTRGGTPCSGVCATCENPCPTGQRIKARRAKRNRC
jgi:Fe-S cluster assembly iron-binding protein IscA